MLTKGGMSSSDEKLLISNRDKRCKTMSKLGLNKSACAISLALVVLLLLLFHNLLDNLSPFRSDPGKYDFNYGVIIDAGSTGSRLFLYRWKSPSPGVFIDIKSVNDYFNQPVVKKVTPGLSAFGDKPEAAAEYIKPLLDYAAQFVDSRKLSSTPVFIFATAGMRLLSVMKQNMVMSALHKNLPLMTNFQVNPSNIQVISGKWEGIYSWIAVNYMLGRFNFSLISDERQLIQSKSEDMRGHRPTTAGIIDMGGASAQIAFEMPLNNSFSNENLIYINLGSREEDFHFVYKLFVTTFLGFGANEGAKKYENWLQNKLIDFIQLSNQTLSDSAVKYMDDSCLPRDFLKLVTKDDGQQFVRKGTGKWDDCVNNLAYLLFHSPEVPRCPATKKCFFGGVVAPGISLSDVELYGFSEYWYSVEDVLSLGGIYNHNEFETKARSFCEQSWMQIRQNAAAKIYPHADDERLQTQCFKSAWIHSVLHNGFYVDENHNSFQSSFKINGEEVQWTLGAMIYQTRYFPSVAAHGGFGMLRNSLWDSSTLFYVLLIFILIYALYMVTRRKYVSSRTPFMKNSSSIPSEFACMRELYRDV